MGTTDKVITGYQAASKLQKLAQTPYSLTEKGVLAEKRLEKYICSTEMFDLHYGMQRVDDSVLDTLQELAEEAHLLTKFMAMKKGEVVNRIEGVESENRQVLHTACRDLFAEIPHEEKATRQAQVQMEKLKCFLTELEDGSLLNFEGKPFTTMIHIGIGGSDLGPRAIYEALRCYKHNERDVYFISNVDPDDAAAVLKSVDLRRTLINIVSKSGSTLETLTNEELVRSALIKKGLNPALHCISVTGEKSPMDTPEKYLRSFYMYDYIGGRYSSTSMVGVVMLGFALGYKKVESFLQGAARIDRAAEEKDIRKNIPLLLAMLGVWNHNFLHYPTVAVLPYCQALHRFPAHLQQCDMESNGKSVGKDGKRLHYKTGPIVWGEPGTNGQHAFYQLLHQGTEIVPVEFVGFRQSQAGKDMNVQGTTSQQKLLANLFAQAVALATGEESQNPNKQFDGNRPSSILLADRLSPETMGGLLALYEAKIVFQGFLWDINSFDQEGVQLGKTLAGRFLEAIKSQESIESSLERTILKKAKIL